MKHRTLTLDPFPVSLTIILGTETEFRRHMLKCYDYTPGLDLELDPYGGAYTALEHPERTYTLVIWISSLATPTSRLGTLVHETSHAVDATLKYINAGTDEGSGETRAYLSGWIVGRGLELIVPEIRSK